MIGKGNEKGKELNRIREEEMKEGNGKERKTK